MLAEHMLADLCALAAWVCWCKCTGCTTEEVLLRHSSVFLVVQPVHLHQHTRAAHARKSANMVSANMPGGTKHATSLNMPLLRLQSSEGKFTMSREIEPHLRKWRVYRSGTFGAFWAWFPFSQGDAGRLHDSVHAQIFSLPSETLIYPGHDYKGRSVSTVAEDIIMTMTITTTTTTTTTTTATTILSSIAII